MADIFISYAKEDRSRVVPLVKAFEDQGWSVWWDRTIPPGMTFVEVIKKAIDEAKCVVVLWSRNSVKSDWVQEEANIAKRRKILVPANLDHVDPPFGFGLIQAADLTDWEAETSHIGFTRLVNAILGKAGPPTKREKIEQVADIPKSNLEQQLEVQTKERDTPQPTPLQSEPSKIKRPEPKSVAAATTEPRPSELLSPKLRKAGNSLKFGVLAGVAVLLAVLIYVYFSVLQKKEFRTQALSQLAKEGTVTEKPKIGEVLSILVRTQLQEFREETKRRDKETRMLQQQLVQIQSDLYDTRQHLKQLTSETEDQTQRQELSALTLEVDRYEETINVLQEQLAKNEAIFKNLPAPRIEIYDPLAPTTRGVTYKTSSQDPKERLIAGMVWAPAGLASFKVNQKTERVEPDGKFRVQVPMNPYGETIVAFVAVDKRGRRTRVKHKLAQGVDRKLSSLEISEIGTINFGRYHALIIGNINYRELPKLKTAVNDARGIENILRKKYGFSTRLLIDATRDDIVLAIHHYEETLTENDNLLIYYAGHGYVDVKNNRGYWQPVDADKDNSSNWIANYSVTDMVNVMRAKNVLIISDSCYSGSLTRGVAVQQDFPQTADSRLQYLKELAKGRARKVLTSGELAPVLDAGRGDHSVFANVLLDVLKSNNQVIEGSLLHQEMSAVVVTDSARFGLTQVPLYASNNEAGHESGDFIFVPIKYQ